MDGSKQPNDHEAPQAKWDKAQEAWAAAQVCWGKWEEALSVWHALMKESNQALAEWHKARAAGGLGLLEFQDTITRSGRPIVLLVCASADNGVVKLMGAFDARGNDRIDDLTDLEELVLVSRAGRLANAPSEELMSPPRKGTGQCT